MTITTILDDIKALIVENGFAQDDEIKYDYDGSKGENIVLLTLYDNSPCDLAMRSSVKITVKNSDLKLSRDTCFGIHNLIFAKDNFQKSVKINGKTMHAKLNNGPFYLEKDSSQRHNYVLNITVTYNR